MTQIEETAPQFQGTFVRQGDPRYEELRIGHVFNQRTTSRMPAAILLPATEDDVVAGVEYAARMGWHVSVRAGGHSWAAWGVRDGALLIDLSSMKDMELDPTTNIVSASPAIAGATELDPFLSARGRFFPVGHCESVGIGGFLLQGGQGWHTRHYGWSCESIKAIDVVLADGRKIRASADENADLLWAARGAGPGFPGIITRFHLKTYALPVLVQDTRTFRLDDLDGLLAWLQRILPDLDRRVEPIIIATRLPDVPLDEGVDRPDGTVLMMHTTAVGSSEAEIAPLLAAFDACPIPGLGHVRSQTTIPEQNTLLAVQNPKGYRWRADCTWTDAPAAELAPRLREMWSNLPTELSWSMWFGWSPSGELPDMALSVEGTGLVSTYICYDNADDDERMADFVHGSTAALAADFGKGVYIGDTDFTRRADRFLSDQSFQRLQEIRSAWDPDYRFCGYLIDDESKLNIHESSINAQRHGIAKIV
jgi:FAD/FMN-containing dehydrogenase